MHACRSTLEDPTDLTPAPAFADEWKKPETGAILFDLIVETPSRLVRVWAMQLLQREHANFAPPVEQLLRLLDHDEPEVQQFGARLLENAPGLATLSVDGWMRLLQTRNDEALQLVCEVFGRQVAPDRISLAQAIELACRQAVPLARLGQKLLQGRQLIAPADRTAVLALAGARCPAVSGELATWALGIVGAAPHYHTDSVTPFLDSVLRETRTASWEWLMASPQALADAALWSRLTESPFDDVRLRLVDFLQKEGRPGDESLRLDDVWRSVLLGVHRGGRQKAKAVQQIAHTLIEEPARAEALLPVLAAAVRSVRGPESRAGLAAVLSTLDARPELAELAKRFLPELQLEVLA